MAASKEWKAAYFQRNKPAYRLRQRNLYNKKRAVICKAKNKPCADCHKKFIPAVMDFDHLNHKRFTIGALGHKVSMTILLAEIAKCEVVCANCHRIRTHKRLRGRVV